MSEWEFCTLVQFIEGDGFYFPPGKAVKPKKFGGEGIRVNASQKITELGNEGWELVNVTSPYKDENHYYFKREK